MLITGRKFGRVRGEDAGVFPFGNVSLKMCAFSGSHFSTVLELDKRLSRQYKGVRDSTGQCDEANVQIVQPCFTT